MARPARLAVLAALALAALAAPADAFDARQLFGALRATHARACACRGARPPPALTRRAYAATPRRMMQQQEVPAVATTPVVTAPIIAAAPAPAQFGVAAAPMAAAAAGCQTVEQVRVASSHRSRASLHRVSANQRAHVSLALALLPQVINAAPNLRVLRTVLAALPPNVKAQLSKQAGASFTLFAPSDAAFLCARALHCTACAVLGTARRLTRAAHRCACVRCLPPAATRSTSRRGC
jgi:hypothetical protein